jgi:periplasmic protein TonB
MRRAALLSLGLHALVAALLVGLSLLRPPAPPPSPPSQAAIEMILNAPGAGDAPRETSEGQDLARPTPPPAALPPPPPVAKAEPAVPAVPEPPPAPAPAIRLGEGGADGLTNEISGDIPASPDPSAPNMPPIYPPEATRRGQQGAVILFVTIAPNGTASAVDIAQSSGYALLDRAAKQAVARWRFKPELDRNGAPVPSRMPIRIRFVLD